MDATIKRNGDGSVVFTFDDNFTDAMIESIKPLMQKYIDNVKEVEMERDRLGVELAKNQTEFFKIQAEKQLEFSRLQLSTYGVPLLYGNNAFTNKNK